MPTPPPGAGANQFNNCLFNLDDDPKQAVNLAEQHPEVVTDLLARWNGYREGVAGRAVPVALTLDPAFIELLQRTGYDFKQDAPAKPR